MPVIDLRRIFSNKMKFCIFVLASAMASSLQPRYAAAYGDPHFHIKVSDYEWFQLINCLMKNRAKMNISLICASITWTKNQTWRSNSYYWMTIKLAFQFTRRLSNRSNIRINFTSAIYGWWVGWHELHFLNNSSCLDITPQHYASCYQSWH